MMRAPRVRSIAILLIALSAISHADAAPKKQKAKNHTHSPKAASIVVDMNTGEVLHFEDAHVKTHPASLTKLMTLYLAFDALKKHKLHLEQKLYASAQAVSMRPIKLGLKVGQPIKVHQAIDALIVKSANDAAVVLAEAIAGSEAQFAMKMTETAKKLGMSDSEFRNASGWHHDEQKTTAIDMAKLAMALKRDFPEYYSLFAKTQFAFNGKTLHGHNHVTKNYVGAEGMKTGFTCPSGYNLVTTASRGDKSLVAVVLGGASAAGRDKKMVGLLDKHFDKFGLAVGKKTTIVAAGDTKNKKIVKSSASKKSKKVAKPSGAQGNKKKAASKPKNLSQPAVKAAAKQISSKPKKMKALL